MAIQVTPIPDLMDGLIPAPALDNEMAKLGTWLLKQEQVALRDLPVSALGALSEYVRDRIHEDRCARFVQESEERTALEALSGEFRTAELRRLEEVEREAEAAMEIPIGGLETMWATVGKTEPVPELDIPRPAPSQV